MYLLPFNRCIVVRNSYGFPASLKSKRKLVSLVGENFAFDVIVVAGHFCVETCVSGSGTVECESNKPPLLSEMWRL
jgi:hypothetical protein